MVWIPPTPVGGFSFIEAANPLIRPYLSAENPSRRCLSGLSERGRPAIGPGTTMRAIGESRPTRNRHNRRNRQIRTSARGTKCRPGGPGVARRPTFAMTLRPGSACAHCARHTSLSVKTGPASADTPAASLFRFGSSGLGTGSDNNGIATQRHSESLASRNGRDTGRCAPHAERRD